MGFIDPVSPWPHFSDTHVLPIPLHGPPIQASAHGAGQLRTVRAVAPKTGTLNGFYVANTGLGTTTTHNAVIYRVNKSTLTRTKLWESGWLSTTLGVANNWYNVAALSGATALSQAVAAYDWLDLGLAITAASGPTWLRSATWAIGPRLPNSGDFASTLYSTSIGSPTALPASLTLGELGTGTPAMFVACTYA